MPRYVLCVEEVGSEPADEWTELLDLDEAKAVAARVARDHLSEQDGKSWDSTDWRVAVKDAEGLPIFAMAVSITST